MKEIEGMKSYYVDEVGRVYSHRGVLLRELKVQEVRGKRVIRLGGKGFVVARLVAKVFLDCSGYVYHKNGDRLDDRVENLECVDEEEYRARNLNNLRRVKMRYTITKDGSSRSFVTLKEAVKQSGYSAYWIYNSLKYGDKLDVDFIWTKEAVDDSSY